MLLRHPTGGILPGLTPSNVSAATPTRIGLHATAEEVVVWQDRAANGPYKTAGDVSTNSPGDWDRIQSNADDVGTETTWSGQSSASSWPGSPVPGRTRGEKLTDAGIIYLITGTTSYRTSVRDLLISQAGVTGTDFSDATRWDTDAWYFDQVWELAHWFTKLLYAYDYIRADITAGDRTTLDGWFTDAATWFQVRLDAELANQFPNRESDDYATGAPGACEGSNIPIYYGGPIRCGNFHYRWENTLLHGATFYGQLGVMLDNTTFINSAKRVFKEWIRFNIFSTNSSIELERWADYSGTPQLPNLGWSYEGLMIGEMMVIADALARNGDTELYDYSTSLGMANVTAAGGPKSLLGIITRHMQYMDHTVTVYGTDNPARQTADYIIDSVDQAFSGAAFVEDTDLCMANMYYKDSYIQSAYLRTASGAPAYPASPDTGGYAAWRGPWGTFPCILGMYGQMESSAANPF